MKKLLNIAITLCMLAAGAGLLLLAGPAFINMLSGAKPLEKGEELSQAEGRYISYEAAYPVASCVEEYYSGDPDRVRTEGYVVYDEERQAFIYVVVEERSSGEFRALMRKMSLTAQMRDEKMVLAMAPIYVEGSLEPMEKSDVERAASCLQESDVVGIYADYANDDSNAEIYDAYFGDKYGKVLEAMCMKLESGGQSMDWYYLERGAVNGMAKHEIWISVLAAVLSLLIFVYRVIHAISKGKKPVYGAASGTGNAVQRLLDAQRGWVEKWCEFSLNRARRLAYLSAAGGAVILTAIGIAVGQDLQGILAFHFPLGLLLGETAAVLLWVSQKKQSKPDKIIERLEKNIEREMPTSAERESFAEDITNADQSWVFQEKTKDTMLYGIVGEHYWVLFSGIGQVTVVDSRRLKKIKTEVISGSVRVNKVRTYYKSYAAGFYYENASPKKGSDKAFGFNTEDAIGFFMVLVRKRLGDSIEITAE